MNSPLVSFIIPAYNHEKYITEAVRSAITQTYTNVELLVIDDGSTDSTWQKLLELEEECKQRFVRTVFARQSNTGTSLTLRALYSMVQGEFVCSCASDDKFKPTAVERMATFLSEHPDYGFVVGDNEFIDAEGHTCFWAADHHLCYDKTKARFRTFADFLKTRGPFSNASFGTYSSLYLRNYIPNGFMFRKSVYNHLESMTDEAPLEDWFIMLQLSKYTKFKYLDTVLYSYRCHDSNTVKNTAHMGNMEYMTRLYEEKVLSHIVANPPLPLRPDVMDAAVYGVLYKRHGIPKLCEIITYRKGCKKLKKLILFSQEIAQWQKNQ